MKTTFKVIGIVLGITLLSAMVIVGTIRLMSDIDRRATIARKEAMEHERKLRAVERYERQVETNRLKQDAVKAEERTKFENETWELVRQGEMSPEFARKLLGIPLTYSEAEYIVNRRNQERKERLYRSSKYGE